MGEGALDSKGARSVLLVVSAHLCFVLLVIDFVIIVLVWLVVASSVATASSVGHLVAPHGLVNASVTVHRRIHLGSVRAAHELSSIGIEGTRHHHLLAVLLRH